MHNFNYWLQDRDIKYFKEFYLLKGFVFNEQGELKDVSEPKLDDDGRFWLIPQPGAMPNTDGRFDDRDLIRIKANSPNVGALVRQHQDRWKEFNAKQTAQKAKNAPQPTDPSFASTSPRSLMPRNTGHEVSLERQQAHFKRMEYAQKLGLDMEKARKQEYDQTINNAIAKDAIENKKPSFTKLNGATFNTFDYKRTLVNTHGKDWLKWDKVIKNIWDADGNEILAIRAGKYDIKPTETEPELPSTAIKQTYAEPTEAEVAELAKIQEELKTLHKRLKDIQEYLKSDTTGDRIGEEENNRLTAEAIKILPQIKTLEAKKIALNKRKPVATPPAVASTPPAMPPAPNQNQAGQSTDVLNWNPNTEKIPIRPPTPQQTEMLRLKREEEELRKQHNELADRYEKETDKAKAEALYNLAQQLGEKIKAGRKAYKELEETQR